jgi:Na+/melibiose symporter-like transporter
MVFLNQHSVAQILILLGLSVIFQIIIVIANPMKEKWDQRLTWIIEVGISIYLYVLLSLTDFMGENTVREELGWVLTILTGTIIAINVSIFFCKSFWRAFACIKHLYEHLFI